MLSIHWLRYQSSRQTEEVIVTLRNRRPWDNGTNSRNSRYQQKFLMSTLLQCTSIRSREKATSLSPRPSPLTPRSNLALKLSAIAICVKHDEDAERGASEGGNFCGAHNGLMGIWSSGCLWKSVFVKLTSL
jgi:hypothetical protein